jgi:hypothetical protein
LKVQNQETVQRNLRAHLELIRRYLFTLAAAIWLGGFTFYTVVVIHTGHRVLGSLLEVGFLTQQVTRWLNLIGVAALLIFLWNTIHAWRGPHTKLRGALAMTWLIMAAAQIALFWLHPALDRLLNAETHQVFDRFRFHSLHNNYMFVSTVLWATGLLHLWFALAVWRGSDVDQIAVLAQERERRLARRGAARF